MWVTPDGGSWQPLAFGLPHAPVLDLALHDPTRELTAGGASSARKLTLLE